MKLNWKLNYSLAIKNVTLLVIFEYPTRTRSDFFNQGSFHQLRKLLKTLSCSCWSSFMVRQVPVILKIWVRTWFRAAPGSSRRCRRRRCRRARSGADAIRPTGARRGPTSSWRSGRTRSRSCWRRGKAEPGFWISRQKFEWFEFVTSLVRPRSCASGRTSSPPRCRRCASWRRVKIFLRIKKRHAIDHRHRAWLQLCWDNFLSDWFSTVNQLFEFMDFELLSKSMPLKPTDAELNRKHVDPQA